jgi:hypothetical protein
MVARDDQQAGPKDVRPMAPTLLEFFLEALAKRKGRDQHPQAAVAPSADQGAAIRTTGAVRSMS